jgi:hypothetical protein
MLSVVPEMCLTEILFKKAYYIVFIRYTFTHPSELGWIADSSVKAGQLSRGTIA